MNLFGDGEIVSSLGASAGWLIGCGVFLAVALAEVRWPARQPSVSMAFRWAGNFVLYGAGFGVAPILAMYSAAVAVSATDIGLLNHLALPDWLRFCVALLGLDLGAYATHRLSHRVPFLWRLHAVHHSDPDLDVSTMFRHHPLELVAAGLITGGITVVMGFTPEEIAAYAAMSYLVQTVAHMNVQITPGLDAMLRHLLVTPRFHAVHHSALRAETDSNYGELLSIWDRLFGTVSDATGGASRTFGLESFRDAAAQLPHWVLAQPFLPRTSPATPSPHRPAS